MYTASESSDTEALYDPSQVGRLSYVLQVVSDHAHQSDADGDRRGPLRVDHSPQVSVGEVAQICHRVLVDLFEVAEE